VAAVRRRGRRHRPASSLIAPLEAAELDVLKPSTRARAAADSGFYDAVTEQALRYVPLPALDAAVAGAAKRPLGDSWAWARRGTLRENESKTGVVAMTTAMTTDVWSREGKPYGSRSTTTDSEAAPAPGRTIFEVLREILPHYDPGGSPSGTSM
jgi:hypothetical protein